MLNLSRLDPGFTTEVTAEPGGENLLLCYSCGTCISTCLVKRYNPEFNPRKLMRMVALGMREQALSDPTYWLCSACDACYERCPQHIHISDLMKAVRTVSIRADGKPPFATAEVDTDLCSGCSTCARVCPYEAITMIVREENGREHMVSYVDPTLCMSCGICAASCPSLAITVPDFSHEQILTQLGAGGWLDQSHDEPKLAVFVCNWSLRADEDVALLDFCPPNVRIVRVPCSGRVDPLFALFVLEQAVDGVMVVGCQPGECHYKDGNYIEHSRLSLLKTVLGSLGMKESRLRFERLGAADRGRFASVVDNMLAELNGGTA